MPTMTHDPFLEEALIKCNVPINAGRYEMVYWKDVREEVRQVAPEFAAIVDEIDPGEEYPLFTVQYPYGDYIIKDGIFQFPLGAKGNLYSFNDTSFPEKIRKHFMYCGSDIPAGVMLHNAAELYVHAKGKIISWNLFEPGLFFSLWGRLEKNWTHHPFDFFDLTSGARSIFFAANIGNEIHHRRLRKEFNLRLDAPHDLLSQWQVFKAIANYPAARCHWHTKLLLFTDNWIKKIQSEDKVWAPLDRFLLRYAWEDSSYLRNKIFYDCALSQTQAHYKIRPNPYIIDIIKHLYMIIMKKTVGFAPISDDTAAPISLIQKAYIEHYGLEEYTPTILHPRRFSLVAPGKPVYFSLHLPNSLEFSPHSNKYPTALRDLKGLKKINFMFIRDILSNWLKLDNMPISDIIKKVSFEYFHSEFDREREIRFSSEMPEEDPNLIAKYPGAGKKFPDCGAFFRGCVRIAFKIFLPKI